MGLGADFDLRDPNVRAVLGLYEALNHRDFVALQRQVSLDVTLHLGGSGPLAGTYQGMGEVIAVGMKVEDRFVPGASELESIEGNDRLVHTVVTVRLKSSTGEAVPVRLVGRFRFDDRGRLREFWVDPEDPAALDSLLGW